MSDVPQGPGWWQASDGRWYAPQQQPPCSPPPGHVPPAPWYGPPPVPPPGSSSSGTNVLVWVLVAIGVVPAPDFTCRVTDVERYSDEPSRALTRSGVGRPVGSGTHRAVDSGFNVAGMVAADL